MINLVAGSARVVIDPDAGGRLASLSLAGFDLLTGSPDDGPMGWGSYPMVPWAGRVRHGRFSFDGQQYELPRTDAGRHAIHGSAYLDAWRVIDKGPDFAELDVPLDWPLGGRAHQHVQLFPDRVVCVLAAIAGDRPMPAMVGWHPWFARPVRSELRFARMYRRDAEDIPSGDLVAPAPGPRDDCFVEPLTPLRLTYDRWTVTVASDCDHWVVYDEPRHAVCVEPQSAPPDAFNLGLGARLDPAEMLQRTMVVSWREPSAG